MREDRAKVIMPPFYARKHYDWESVIYAKIFNMWHFVKILSSEASDENHVVVVKSNGGQIYEVKKSDVIKTLDEIMDGDFVSMDVIQYHGIRVEDEESYDAVETDADNIASDVGAIESDIGVVETDDFEVEDTLNRELCEDFANSVLSELGPPHVTGVIFEDEKEFATSELCEFKGFKV